MLDRPSWFLASVSIIFAATAIDAHASRSCGDPKSISTYDAMINPDKGTPYTDKAIARQAFLRYIDNKHSNDGNADVLYFVLPEKTKGGDPVILTVSCPRDADHLPLDSKILDTLERYPEVQVFNKSGNPSLYFLPYTEQGLRGAIPEYDFRSARQHDRYAGNGCSVVSFKKNQIYSIVGNSIASWGDKVADTQRNAFSSDKTKEMTLADIQLYKDSVKVAKRKFEEIKVPGRNLAIANPEPYGPNIDDRLEKILKEANGRPINFGNNGIPFIQKAANAK